MKRVDQFVIFSRSTQRRLARRRVRVRKSIRKRPAHHLGPEIRLISKVRCSARDAREIRVRFVVCAKAFATKMGVVVSSLDADGKDRQSDARQVRQPRAQLACWHERCDRASQCSANTSSANGEPCRGEFQILESLPMCSADRATALDIKKRGSAAAAPSNWRSKARAALW